MESNIVARRVIVSRWNANEIRSTKRERERKKISKKIHKVNPCEHHPWKYATN